MKASSFFHYQADDCAYGCKSAYHCKTCGTTVRCDSSGRAGTWADDTYFIEGPCCCVAVMWGLCAACAALAEAAELAEREDRQREEANE